MRYELFYWPSIQGRGEFVRLALEAADADYVDVAREQGRGLGVDAMLRLMEDPELERPPFGLNRFPVDRAPEILRGFELAV